jgi:hypothetical protein
VEPGFQAITDPRRDHDYWFMTSYTKRAGLAALLAFTAMLAVAPLAQAEPVGTSTPQAEVLVPAPVEAAHTAVPKIKIKGVVTRRDADAFTVR